MGCEWPLMGCEWPLADLRRLRGLPIIPRNPIHLAFITFDGLEWD
jgi:hypothetical protein